MVEIPVRHKEKKSGVPLWLLLVGFLGLLAAGLFFFRSSSSSATPVSAAAGDLAAAPGKSSQARAIGATCTGDKDCSSSQLCSDGNCRAISAGSDCSETRVHFATDSATIQEADRPLLDRMARCLQDSQGIKLAIEGNADQRGTDEHNAQLADQRARTIAAQLQVRGVSTAQLRVVSYGENNLLCGENDQDCWAKNRRAAVRPEAR